MEKFPESISSNEYNATNKNAEAKANEAVRLRENPTNRQFLEVALHAFFIRLSLLLGRLLHLLALDIELTSDDAVDLRISAAFL